MSLTSRQRVKRAIQRESTDCVAAAPFMYDLAAVVAGISLGDYTTSAPAMARAQLALHDLVGHDIISVGSDNFYIAEGFGCQTTMEADELPSLKTPAVGALAEVFDLTVPDPESDGRMPVMLEAIRLVRQAVGDDVAIRSPGTGPFALASYFIGSQPWLLEIGMVQASEDRTAEAALHHALGLASEALIRFGKACWDAGADIIQCGDSLASCDVVSPDTYRRFAFPYQRQVFQAWKQYGIATSLLHICGDSTRVLEMYADTGANIVEIDNKVDLNVAKQRIGGRVTLMGNVHTVTDLLQGDRATVRRSAERCIQQAGPGGGFILGSGCLVPRRTPIENVQEMVRTAHQQPYP